MAINLGLKRITRFLKSIGNPHHVLRVLHVSGTNGKGSVCSYLSSILKQESDSVRIGKFSSPHLVNLEDSITLNDIPIPKHEFASIKWDLMKHNEQFKCTEFEILTCIAFIYFKKMKCNWCVLEVGMGGSLDATNVFLGKNKICGITKVDIDHENVLGFNLIDIAKSKLGILTEGVEFTAIDATNDDEIIRLAKERSDEIGSEFRAVGNKEDKFIRSLFWGDIGVETIPLNGEYQKVNLSVALAMLDFLKMSGKVENLERNQVIEGIRAVKWPGRLQYLNYFYGENCSHPLLLDGAHNRGAAIELQRFLDEHYRQNGDGPLRFIIGMTQSKNAKALLEPVLRKGDSVIATKFGLVSGMPWIQPFSPSELAKNIKMFVDDVKVIDDPVEAVRNIAENYPKDKLVVYGSLYLCGYLLRNQAKGSMRF